VRSIARRTLASLTLARFADRHGLGQAQLGKAHLGKAQRPFAPQGGQDQRCSLASDRRPAIGHLGGRFAPAEGQNSFTAAKYGFGWASDPLSRAYLFES